MTEVDIYVQAATRANTRRSYTSAVRHFEVEWGGFLPASVDVIARYLAHHADQLSIATLRQRLAALSRWHQDHGFADPTKAPMVRKTMQGIQALHPAPVRQAVPLQIGQLSHAVTWLDGEIATQGAVGQLRCTRDKAMLLLGFWRGFRSDGAGDGPCERKLLNRGHAAELGKIFRRLVVAASKILQHPRIADEGFPALFVNAFELGQVLHDAPKLHPEARHEAVSLFDHGQAAKGGHFIEKEKDRLFRLHLDIAGVDGQGLLHEQAQPAPEGFQPVGGQDEVDRHFRGFQIFELEA